MNAVVQHEVDKLTDFQKSKYYELVAWQTMHNVGQSLMSDTACFNIINMVKRMEEPQPVEEVKEESE